MEKLKQLAELIRHAKSTVFFGGAGVSTESGIPDFRGNQGLYTARDKSELSPEQILHCDFFKQYPWRFYEYYRSHMLYPNAEPNAAHRVLARLEACGKLSAVITQNIDGLHQRAGSQNVIELHGTTLTNSCTRCGVQYGPECMESTDAVPCCPDCGGLIRPDIVLYGEGLPMDSWVGAQKAIAEADLLIVGGTSLTVHPAAGLVLDFDGANLIIINRTPTSYDEFADLILRDPIAEVFASIEDELFN